MSGGEDDLLRQALAMSYQEAAELAQAEGRVRQMREKAAQATRALDDAEKQLAALQITHRGIATTREVVAAFDRGDIDNDDAAAAITEPGLFRRISEVMERRKKAEQRGAVKAFR